MTGILPIKKYGTHSALNIFDEFSMTEASLLAEYAGFTEKEVRMLCEQYHTDYSDMKQWYDGYCLGDGMHIYNPKSVVDALRRKK
ncbi:MAG: AAA family ATPase [Eubacterium sp.]